MLTEIDILKDIIGRLDALSLPYMLTGSVAMNYYAVPRMTRDIDMVITLASGSVAGFVQALTPDYMIVEEAVASAVAEDFMFNAIHEEAIIKLVFVCLKNDAFRLLEFERRQQVSIGDFKTSRLGSFPGKISFSPNCSGPEIANPRPSGKISSTCSPQLATSNTFADGCSTLACHPSWTHCCHERYQRVRGPTIPGHADVQVRG